MASSSIAAHGAVSLAAAPAVLSVVAAAAAAAAAALSTLAVVSEVSARVAVNADGDHQDGRVQE